MNVNIEIIPHEKQRYPTVGDWIFKGDNLEIKVSKLGDWRMEMLVAIHELVEVIKCQHDGVTQQEVDAFDIAFEKARPPGNVDEPGDEWNAPYSKQHCLATGIERIMAAELGVSWSVYESVLNKLP